MSTLTKITAEAKRIRKAHPRKYDKLSNPWSGGYIKEAARNVNKGKVTRPAKKKKAAPVKKKKRVVSKKGSRKRKAPRRVGAVVKAVGRAVGRRRKRKAPRKVSGASRRRSVGSRSNMGLIIGIGALALGAVYLMTKDQPPPTYQQLPPLQQTGNYTRDQQSNNVLSWAMAAGLTISAITSLIDRLNNGSDQEVNSIYTDVATNNDVTAWI